MALKRLETSMQLCLDLWDPIPHELSQVVETWTSTVLRNLMKTLPSQLEGLHEPQDAPDQFDCHLLQPLTMSDSLQTDHTLAKVKGQQHPSLRQLWDAVKHVQQPFLEEVEQAQQQPLLEEVKQTQQLLLEEVEQTQRPLWQEVEQAQQELLLEEAQQPVLEEA
jgi:hypothetical protein